MPGGLNNSEYNSVRDARLSLLRSFADTYAQGRVERLGVPFAISFAAFGPRVDAQVFDVPAELAAVADGVFDGIGGPVHGEQELAREIERGERSEIRGLHPLGVWARMMIAQPAGAEVGCTGPPRGASAME